MLDFLAIALPILVIGLPFSEFWQPQGEWIKRKKPIMIFLGFVLGVGMLSVTRFENRRADDERVAAARQSKEDLDNDTQGSAMCPTVEPLTGNPGTTLPLFLGNPDPRFSLFDVAFQTFEGRNRTPPMEWPNRARLENLNLFPKESRLVPAQIFPNGLDDSFRVYIQTRRIKCVETFDLHSRPQKGLPYSVWILSNLRKIDVDGGKELHTPDMDGSTKDSGSKADGRQQ
jgi:hypothetical protein